MNVATAALSSPLLAAYTGPSENSVPAVAPENSAPAAPSGEIASNLRKLTRLGRAKSGAR